MKLFQCAIAAVVGCLLTSCGMGSYSNPKGTADTLAELKCTERSKFIGLYAREQYSVLAIDAQDVYYGNSWSPETKKLYLTPGWHNVTIEVFKKRGLDPYRGMTDVLVKAKPGDVLRVNGKILGAGALVWVEADTTKLKVANPKSVSLYLDARQHYTPILLPVYY